MTITIEQVIEKIADWRDKDVSVQPISGGLTNTNYRVEVAGTPYVVRIPGPSTELLAVNRENEYYNTKAAAEAGVGAKIAHYLPEDRVMVLEYIYGETMSIEALQRPGMPTRIAQALKLLHTGPRFLTDFNMFRLTEYYLEIVAEYGVRIPEGFRERMPLVYEQIEPALLVNPLPTVPCNNDLLAENYIDDGHLLRTIDFEYSGNNDPCFELGNTCQEQQYDEPRIVEMCAAYFGEPYPEKLARMKLNMIMSDVGWTLWAAIQAKISTIDFDFWGWAVERWARAEAKMDSAEFKDWLREVTHS
ncbi:MAG: phosphotransferase family protein [Anaerolineae bacterium]|nr:phosphotransferase family protein [Anaerolineales bacterium]MCQ3972167.1 LPS biosynthesis choline kinase [Anaerolineae bacterium]